MPRNKVVKLRNGDEVPEAAIFAISLNLQSLLSLNAIAMYELWRFCNDEKYPISSASKNDLQCRCLIDKNGDVHDVVKSIVLSAISFKGSILTIYDPIAET